MSKKIKLTSAQANMIENHRNNFETLMSKRITEGCSTYLDSLSVEEVVKAFIDGYDIELTPEEKILEIYLRELEIANTSQETSVKWEHKAFANGIKFTLDELGVEIEGINGDE